MDINQVMAKAYEAIKEDPTKMFREFFGQEIQRHRQEIKYHQRKITELKKMNKELLSRGLK